MTGSAIATQTATTLPSLNRNALASILDRTNRADSLTQAELLILEGQYLVRWREGEKTYSKFISAAAVREAFTNLPVDSGFLPTGVVRWGSTASWGEWMLQFISPSRHHLLLVTDTHTSITIPLPGLLFAGRGTSYYLWAVKSRQFDASSYVFHAPLPNINRQGQICFGSNAVPVVSPKTLPAAWQLCITSPFNSDSTSGKSKAHPKDVRSQLLAVAKGGRKKYPLRDLVPVSSHNQLTVTQLLDKFLNV